MAYIDVSCTMCGGHASNSENEVPEPVTLTNPQQGDWKDKTSSVHERITKKKCPLCGVWEETKETASHDKSAKEEVIASNWTYNSDQHWHVKKTTKMCSVCGHKFETTQSEVNKGSHNFKKTSGSWVANADGYYHRTNTSVCQTCGYTKTEDERGEKVHTHRWVSASGSWYDYDSTRHTKNNWEYCNGTPTPCGETHSLGNSYESHNSSGQRTDNDLSGWLYDDNHNDRHDDNETHHWKEQQTNSKRHAILIGLAYIKEFS